MIANTKKTVDPKIYSLVLEGKDVMFLSVQLAYSLEEAYLGAQKEFLSQNPKGNVQMMGARINLFAFKEFSDLFLDSGFLQSLTGGQKNLLDEIPKEIKDLMNSAKPIKSNHTNPFSPFKEPTIKKIDRNLGRNPAGEKNQLIQKILKETTWETLDANKNKFSEVEFKYLKDKVVQNQINDLNKKDTKK